MLDIRHPIDGCGLVRPIMLHELHQVNSLPRRIFIMRRRDRLTSDFEKSSSTIRSQYSLNFRKPYPMSLFSVSNIRWAAFAMLSVALRLYRILVTLVGFWADSLWCSSTTLRWWMDPKPNVFPTVYISAVWVIVPSSCSISPSKVNSSTSSSSDT